MTEITLMSLIIFLLYIVATTTFVVLPFILAALFLCFYQSDSYVYMTFCYIQNKIGGEKLNEEIV